MNKSEALALRREAENERRKNIETSIALTQAGINRVFAKNLPDYKQNRIRVEALAKQRDNALELLNHIKALINTTEQISDGDIVARIHHLLM